MSNINNTELLIGMRDNAKVQNTENIPSQLADKVVPVMEVNPMLLRRCNIVKGNVRTSTGVVTIYTTPTNKDFYLTSVCFGVSKDAVCNVATGLLNISISVEGTTAYTHLCNTPVITLTASSSIVSQSFPVPIKLDRNTTVSMASTFGAGVLVLAGNIAGYTVEN